MAEQAAKIIDISRSYVPMDPNAFPESMHSTGGEDTPEGRIPVIPYDGYNFMPTAYGYMSYFGVDSKLGIDALTSRCDDIFIVQSTFLENILVALCEDGIWTKMGNLAGAWTNIVPLAVPASGLHYNWTRCVIGNNVYLYRAGNAQAYVLNQGNLFVPTGFTPTHLNMAAQQGIFKAGARLGFWDSANSVTWANPDDASDFVPSLETGVGATVFQQIVGKIVNVKQHGDGFVIYATRSIVHVRRTSDAYMFWNANAIFTENGISYLNECCHGQPDNTHFAYTTFGIIKIQDGQSEYIIPEIFTYLKESREPVYLRLLEGRYLFFQFLDQRYVGGIPNFSIEIIEGSTITWAGASYAVEYTSEDPGRALRAVEKSMESLYLNQQYGYINIGQADTPGIVPIWEDHLVYSVPKAELEAFKAVYLSGTALPRDYFTNTYFSNGALTLSWPNPISINLLPASCPQLALYFEPKIFVEPNTQDFYNKQESIWFWERQYIDAWLQAIDMQNTYYTDLEINGHVMDATPPDIVWPIYRTYGPYMDLSYFSEANKYYGVADKSAWLQRSLTKGIFFDVTVYTFSHKGWAGSGTPSGSEANLFSAVGGVAAQGLTATYANWDALIAALGPFRTWYQAQIAAFNATNTWPGSNIQPVTREFDSVYIVYQNAIPAVSPGGYVFLARSKEYNHEMAQYIGNSYDGSVIYTSAGLVGLSQTNYINPTFQDRDVMTDVGMIRIPGIRIRKRVVDVDTCLYKEIGFTKIKGHGHYNLDGSFTVDDSTAEAADNGDICIPTAPKKKKGSSSFNGIPIPEGLGYAVIGGPVTIDGYSYSFSYAPQTLDLPPGSFLLQNGSIEPIYPTFPGAFVFDIHYKKWGKMVQDHIQLLNYSPVNSHAGDKPVPYDIFSVNAGCLLPDGEIAIFDKAPDLSILKIGKIGYYRKGFTNGEEVRLQFRTPATGTVTLEGSIDGKLVQPAISQIESFDNEYEHTAFFSNSARWFNVVIEGSYDLKNVDYSGVRRGKR